MPGDEKPTKADALAEVQNRILALEQKIESVKGAEADTIRSLAREEVKRLEQEMADLKAALAPKPPVKEKGFFEALFGED